MPGMNSGLNINDPIVVAAFRSALLHQGIAALLIFAVLSIVWVAIREWRPQDRVADRPAEIAEPAWRQALRMGFGLLWVFDGILQAQPKMAVGLPSKVIEPAAAGSPHWLQHIINWAGTAWSYHPVQAGASVVWIQIGIGLWLLFAGGPGTMSRLAGLASAAWGVVVWIFGESLGGILAPGLSWLTGAPGAAAIYAVAGVLIALPVRYWRRPALSRLLLGGIGVFLAGMAVLQAWPGRGYWQGTLHGQPGALTSMVTSMASTSQPSALARLVADFGSLVAAHGFAVNLLAVLVLAVLGSCLIALAVAGPDRIPAAGRGQWLVRGPFIVLGVFCLADWVLVQDFGFFGGLGTDPNSMIPIILLATAGYLALTGMPSPQAESRAEPSQPASRAAWRERLRPAALTRSFASSRVWTMLSACAVGVVIIGALPMAAAQASRSASPILAEAVDGSSAPLHTSAPAIALTDQHGRSVSLASLHGKAVLLTFLDPVCTTDCPLEAQEFRQAGVLLGSDDSKVELVAVDANPLYTSVAYTRAFDREQSLGGVRNWLYLTGSLAHLHSIWRQYGIAAQTLPAGSMVGHSEVAFVIDPNGHMRQELDFDPGPGTTATISSFATELATAARQALASG